MSDRQDETARKKAQLEAPLMGDQPNPSIQADPDDSFSTTKSLILENAHLFRRPGEIKNKDRLNYESDELIRKEPKGTYQKFKCVLSNTYEITLVLFIVTFGLAYPSFVVAMFVILCQNMLCVSAFGGEKRIRLGRYAMYFNLAVLLLTMAVKLIIFIRLNKNPTHKSVEAMFAEEDKYEALGFTTDCNRDDPSYPLKMTWSGSFTFELLLLVAFLLTIKFIDHLDYMRNKLMKKRLALTLIKYQAEKTDIYSDSEDEDTGILGTTGEARQEQEAKLARKNYRDSLRKVEGQLPRFFIDCKYFEKQNKLYYLGIIFFQLSQAMASNGLFDIPTLMLILLSVALYAYRQSFIVGYTRLLFCLVYYMKYAMTMKVLIIICLRIPFMQQYARANAASVLVRLVQLTFGDTSYDEKNGDPFSKEHLQMVARTFLLIPLCLWFTQAWIQTKWLDIRVTLNEAEPQSFGGFFSEYCKVKKDLKIKQQIDQKILEEIKSRVRDEYVKSGGRKSKLKEKKRRLGAGESISAVKNDINKFGPILSLTLLQILLSIQAYMYHTGMSLFQLCWVMTSFIFPIDIGLYLGVIFLLPVYLGQFVVVFGLRIPLVKDIEWFQSKAQYFPQVEDMESPIGEQCLYFIILALLFTSFTCLKLISDNSQEDLLKDFMVRKITSPNASVVYKLAYFVLKYIHTVVLLILFYQGSGNLNSARSLGFMLFFVVYTAYPETYRSTSFLLIIFIAYFIVAQYQFSLVYQSYEEDAQLMQEKLWLGFYQLSNPPKWKYGDAVYWRHHPELFYWVLLILMFVLKMINQIFIDSPGQEITSDALAAACEEGIKLRFKNQYIWFIEFTNYIAEYNVYIMMAISFIFLGKIQTSVISTVFFTLVIMMFALISRADNKIATNRWALRLAKLLTWFSAIVLILDLLFLVFIGEDEEEDRLKKVGRAAMERSPWYFFQKHFQPIYRNLDIIGIKVQDKKLLNLTREELEYQVTFKFYSYIAFQLCSIQIASYFANKIVQREQEEKYEDDAFYAKLFSIKSYDGLDEADSEMDEEERRHEEFEHASKEQRAKMNDDGLQESKKGAGDDAHHEDHEEHCFYNKKKFTYLDCQKHLADLRFTKPYITYKNIDWWPLFDTLASYGHFVNNLVIVYISVYYNVSMFMCINVFCVCLNYAICAYKINQVARAFFKESGIQNQVDLKMANMITKKFKVKTSFEYLKIRQRLWKIQMLLLVSVSIIGFPTTLVQKIRRKELFLQQQANQGSVEGIAGLINACDWYIFIAFLGGFYKDVARHEDASASYQDYYYFPMAAMFFGLIIEKQAINWLTNRHGCTYFKLQKFIELDTRCKAIVNKNWLAPPPKYDINVYKNHYIHDDFNQLEERFKEDPKKQEELRRATKYSDEGENRDFVPYKVAKRIKECIVFSLEIRGKAIELQMDEDQEEKIRHLHEENADIEYEEVPILRDHRLAQLKTVLEEAVDRKYKISFYKGCQLAFESVILLVLMISVVLKANVFSLIYMLFIFKYLLSRAKAELLVRLVLMISVTFAFQYLFYVINLTSNSSPLPFPRQFRGYPEVLHDRGDIEYSDLAWKKDFFVPFFFQFEVFKHIPISYLLGVGIETDQLKNLLLDFFNLYLVAMYVLHYRNPILVKSVEKVFWQFPQLTDKEENWQRLSQNVQKQVKWLYKPLQFDAPRFEKLKQCEEFKKEFKYKPEQSEANYSSSFKKFRKTADYQYKWAKEYNENTTDLNSTLIEYVDIKYNEIWGEKFCKEKKREIKNLSLYFRWVKQGSILVYLTFHIITILIVLLMACMRQSLMSLGYVVIVVNFVKQGSRVLSQRDQAQSEHVLLLDSEIEEAEKEVQALHEKKEADPTDFNEMFNIKGDDEERKQQHAEAQKKLDTKIREIKQKLDILRNKKNVQIKESMEEVKTQEQLDDEAENKNMAEWKMLKVIQTYLMIYAMFDFCVQITMQMPTFPEDKSISWIGFRKVWKAKDPADISFDNLMKVDASGNPKFQGLTFDYFNFYLQCMNCFMISILSLQTEIFQSYGYKKFTTQTGGSMDLLVKLAPLKAQSLTYCFNNQKIKKIIQAQRKKEIINETVIQLKQKIKAWREFTRQTLDPSSNKKQKEKEKSKEKENKNPQTPGIKKQEEQAALKLDKRKTRFSEDQQQEGEQKIRLPNKVARLSPEDNKKIINMIADEFVKEKKNKLNNLAQFYLFLQDTFVEKILFKNSLELIQPLLDKHRTGQMHVPTELEQIMTVEAQELIQIEFDHKEGAEHLQKYLQQVKKSQVQSLLKLTNIDQKIKLKHMKRTWAFTRTPSMLLKLVEVFYYIIISNTQSLIYLSMLWSMYENAGILSLVYPLLVFGYALMEETRPKNWFWNLVRNYNQVVLFIKFILNLSVFEPVLTDPAFLKYAAYIKPGIYDYPNLGELLLYMLPEILIMVFIMLNEINLRLCGLYYQIEGDIETVQDGIQRNIAKGDSEEVNMNKIESKNMILKSFFLDQDEQLELIKRQRQMAQAEEGEEADEKNDQKEKEQEKYQKAESQQLDTLRMISGKIWKSSREFDIDDSASKKHSLFDRLIEDNCIEKSLENDNLIVYEGMYQQDYHFIDKEDLREEIDDQNEQDCLSAGDFDEDFKEKNYVIEGKSIPKKTFFEKNEYFTTLFPSLKIQKPGEDYYGSTTCFLALTLVYIFCFWSYITVDPGTMLESVKDSNKIFNGFMSMMLIATIVIMIFERYVNRCDTKAIKDRSIDDAGKEKKMFVGQQDGMKRANTRGMTQRLRTMKTSELDTQSGGAQQFLEQMAGGDDSSSGFDDSRVNITHAQKTKYVMHMALIVIIHLLVFWYIPIQGNMILFGQAECDGDNQKNCRNFKANGYLRAFYCIVCVYLYLSALQIRVGFPILKKPSSVMQYNESVVAYVGAQIYYNAPFVTELRCLLDFTFSKTSLDIFQFWQLFQYHIEMYISKAGNWSYTIRTLGDPVPGLDKCIFGYLIISVIMFVLIGPLFVFSDAGPFIAPNPVIGGALKLAFVIDKNTSLRKMTGGAGRSGFGSEFADDYDDFDNSNDGNQTFLFSSDPSKDIEANKTNLAQLTPYVIYESRNPFLKTLNNETFNASPLHNKTETRFFLPEQVQESYFSDSADYKWQISDQKLSNLKSDLGLAVDYTNKDYNFQMHIEYEYERQQPPDALITKGKQTLKLDLKNDPKNITTLSQFISKCGIEKFSKLECPKGNDASAVEPVEMTFRNAYNPNLVLGANKKVSLMVFDIRSSDGTKQDDSMQSHDLKLTFECPDQWSVQYNLVETWIYNDLKVDLTNTTCDDLPELQKRQEAEDKKIKEWNAVNADEPKNENIVRSDRWSRVRFILLSMMVSSSIFAGYDVTKFYVGVTLVIGAYLKPALLFSWWKGWVYETVDPDEFIRLVEACYMRRHEEDLIGEEECYRMLQEIVRCPELLKALSGSSLMGSCDPKLDRLTDAQRAQLEHLDKLEKKGFEVAQLKKNIIAGTKEQGK